MAPSFLKFSNDGGVVVGSAPAEMLVPHSHAVLWCRIGCQRYRPTPRANTGGYKICTGRQLAFLPHAVTRLVRLLPLSGLVAALRYRAAVEYHNQLSSVPYDTKDEPHKAASKNAHHSSHLFPNFVRPIAQRINMVIVIETNNDMPACLNTETKQKRVAREIAEARFKKPIKSINGPRIQGFFSRTIFVSFKDGSEAVLQFRPEPLDMTPFRIARQILGAVVPEIEQIHNENLAKDSITTYYMTKMTGSTWSSMVVGKKPTALPIINRSIGEIFANGYVREGTSAATVEERLRPHLQLIVDSELPHVKPFRVKAKDLLTQLTNLHVLPLWITHFDLNDMNVLLDDSFHISGIIDWELSFPQPFGVFLGRIHTLAGEYSDGKFHEPPEFEKSERALWAALYEELAAKQSKIVYKTIVDNPEAVQLAVEVGTLLDAFQLEEGKLMEQNNKVVSDSLPKFFSYRIPSLRGNASPYLQ